MDSSPPRILIIDPHLITRDGIVAVLIQALVGTVIIGAGTFPEAIALLASHLIDLVVTDFRVQGAPEPKPEGDDKSQPEAERRSR